MSVPEDERLRARRAFLTRAATVAAVAGTGAAAGIGPRAAAVMPVSDETEPFWGAHQAGIATPSQTHVYFAAFDLTATQREQVAELLQAWTTAAARLTAGQTAEPLPGPLGIAPVRAPGLDMQTVAPGPAAMGVAGTAPPDSGEALGLSPARLTLTFGFGAGLFTRDGHDRYGLGSRRPQALVDLPRFPGDQLVADRTGGDLSVQACADDPQVAFHAVRQLARIADKAAQLRWVQTGFVPTTGAGQTPRNLMGFKDGTNNFSCSDSQGLARFIWVGSEGPEWMRGGSYLVARRIRIALEHWDRMKLAFQEQTVGRHKYNGAPLGTGSEFAPLDLQATDQDGNPVIPENAHVRMASAITNDGARILRRGYSYNDGVNFTAERWPPWRQGMEYDAGLFFLAYQRDPRTGFIKIYEKMSRFDMLNQFVTHVGGGLFACPAGAQKGGFIGQGLFGSA